MAKSGKLTVETGNIPVQPATLTEVAQVTPVVQTAGQTAVDLLRASVDGATAIVGVPPEVLGLRTVALCGDGDEAAILASIVANGTNVLKVAELTFDGGALKNAPMTNAVANGVGVLSTPINAALAAAKPSFSVASILNTIEDIAKETAANKAFVAVVDQVGEKVTVYQFDDAAADIVSVAIGASNDPLAQINIDPTPEASPTNQFGE